MKITDETTARAKAAWNNISDEHNGWDALSQDERDTYAALTAALAVQTQHVAEEEPLASYFARQIDWSRETFGPALRTKGVIDHIRKELVEIEREPHDLSEWIDVVILAMDGFWRHGGKAADLLPSLLAKQRKNMARVWPNWRTMSEDTAIEHDRSCDDEQTECNHKGKGLAVMSWGACCKACGEPWPFEAALVDVPAVESEPVADPEPIAWYMHLWNEADEDIKSDVRWGQPTLDEIERAEHNGHDIEYLYGSHPPRSLSNEGWRPIETAPKDGTAVDLWGSGRRATDVAWGLIRDWMGKEREGWQHGMPDDFEPTHWQPLPVPPLSTRKGSSEGDGSATGTKGSSDD